MLRIMRMKAIFALVLAGLPLLLSAGCAPTGTQNSDMIVVRLEAEPPNLNPFLEDSSAYTVILVDGNAGNIYQSLLRRSPATLEFVPELAESWEVSEDHLTYTFKVRKDVTFSDGKPLTAHDVKFTFDAVLDPKNDTADIRSYLVNLDRVEVVDDYTAVFHCKQPYFGHDEAFGALWIIPKHVFEVGDFNSHPANRNPVGTGPYVLSKWETGQSIVMTARSNYWGPNKPRIGTLHYKIVTDDNAGMMALQRGDFDAMRVRSSEDWLRRANTPQFLEKFNRYELWSPVDGYLGTYSWIGWNARRPQFEDKRVRQAMTMLLDRQRILDTILQGIGRVTSGHASPDSPAYDQNIAPWPYDPERAEALLDEAGWVDSDNDGIRDKDGVPFRFEMIYGTGSAEYDKMTTVYKEALTKAGIDMTLRPLEWASFLESVWKRQFDACMMAWVSPVELDMYQIWHSSQADQGSNYVNFKNAEADRLIEEARLEFDREKRDALNRQVHAILHEEQPYTFLFNRKRMMAVSKRFENVNPYPLGFVMAEWSLPSAE